MLLWNCLWVNEESAKAFFLIVELPVCVPVDEEVGPNGRLKRRRKLSEKAAEAAELQAERGRKISLKKFVPTPKSGKGEPRSSPANKVILGNGGTSSASLKGKNHESQEPDEDADDEVVF